MSSANIFSFGGAKALQAQRAARRDETRLVTLCRWIDQDGLEACLAEVLSDTERAACLDRMRPHLSFEPVADTLERAYERQLERLRHVPMPCEVCTAGAGGLEIRHPHGAHPPTAALEQLAQTHAGEAYVVMLPPGSHEHLSGQVTSNLDTPCDGGDGFDDVEGQVDDDVFEEEDPFGIRDRDDDDDPDDDRYDD